MGIRILHVIPSLAPRAGGTTTVVRQMAQAQARAGHEVTICTTNRDYPKGTLDVPRNTARKEEDVNVIYFRAFVSPLLISLHMGIWLSKHVPDFDIVHIHALYRFPVTFAAICARRKGVPYMVCAHGGLDPFLYRRSRHGRLLKRVYERIFELRNLNRAAAIHYTSSEEMRRAEFVGIQAPPAVIPNGIEWETYANLPEHGRFRRRIGVDDAARLVLFLGRLNFKKGLDILIPAFGRAVRELDDVILAIVGPDNDGFGGKLRQWCEDAGIAGRVKFVEYLPPEQVREAYVDSDVFVLPSYTENFGMTVVEAMACEVPVIVSDQVNIHDVVAGAGAGCVTTCSVEDVAQAMSRLLEDADMRQRMGKAGRRAAEKGFPWPRIVELLEREYEEMLGRGTHYSAGPGASISVGPDVGGAS